MPDLALQIAVSVGTLGYLTSQPARCGTPNTTMPPNSMSFNSTARSRLVKDRHRARSRSLTTPTRLSTQRLQPYLAKDAASPYTDDTANDTEKYHRHLPPRRGLQRSFSTNRDKTVSKMKYLETIAAGNTAINTAKDFPTRSDQNRPVPRSQFPEPDPGRVLIQAAEAGLQGIPDSRRRGYPRIYPQRTAEHSGQGDPGKCRARRSRVLADSRPAVSISQRMSEAPTLPAVTHPKSRTH